MKSLVIYDSAYGNTEKIARVIAKTLGTTALLVRDVQQRDLKTADLVIVGSLTQGGRPTANAQVFLSRISPRGLKGIAIAAFDTRFKKDAHGIFLRLLMQTIGFAAPRIQKLLEDKGGMGIIEPEGFIVQDKEGPLVKGELSRAKQWAETIKNTLP